MARINSLNNLLKHMRSCAEKADHNHEALEAFIDYDHDFHLKIVEYMGNTEFEDLYQRLIYMIRLTSNTALSKKGEFKEH